MSDRPLKIVTILYCIALSISGFSQNNMLLQKVCNSTVPFGECAGGEAEAQYAVSAIYSWKSTIQNAVPIILIMLAGPWSDSHGRRRRPLMFLPLVGQILADVLSLVNVYFWRWSPQVSATCDAIIPGIFGSSHMYWVGLIAYISDNCSNESLTLKYGIINAIRTISHVTGTGLAGYINSRLGFYGAFIVPIILNTSAIVICFVFTKDKPRPNDANNAWLQPSQFVKNYLNVFKNNKKYYAITLISLLIIQAVLVGIMGGEYAITYLFLRYKFKWNEEKYSFFSAYNMLMIAAGTYFSASVLSDRFKISDASLGLIACSFDIVAAFCYVIVNESWQLYLIPFVDIFHGTAIAVSISLTSKITNINEIGRLNSIRGVSTAMLSIVIVPLYTGTYHFTFQYMASAVFLLDIALIFPLVIMFGIISYKCKHLLT